KPAVRAAPKRTSSEPVFMLALPHAAIPKCGLPCHDLSRTRRGVTRRTTAQDCAMGRRAHLRSSLCGPSRDVTRVPSAYEGLGPRAPGGRGCALLACAAQDIQALLVDTESFQYAEILQHVARSQAEVLFVDEDGGTHGRGEMGTERVHGEDAR